MSRFRPVRRSLLLTNLGLAVGLSSVAFGASTVDPERPATLELAQRATLVSLLDRAQAETLELSRTVSADEWNRKPAEDRWSVGDVVQHLVLAERGLQKKIRKMAEAEPHPEWRTLETPSFDALINLISDRSQKAQAPEFFHPKETWTKHQAIEAFLETRHATRTYVLETTDPLESAVGPSPFGSDLTGTRFLAVIGAHNLRHNQQIQEVAGAMR